MRINDLSSCPIKPDLLIFICFFVSYYYYYSVLYVFQYIYVFHIILYVYNINTII